MVERLAYTVDEEDGLFYVFDPNGRAVASYCDEIRALEMADKLNFYEGRTAKKDRK
jgi:hypothetical protein